MRLFDCRNGRFGGHNDRIERNAPTSCLFERQRKGQGLRLRIAILVRDRQPALDCRRLTRLEAHDRRRRTKGDRWRISLSACGFGANAQPEQRTGAVIFQFEFDRDRGSLGRLNRMGEADGRKTSVGLLRFGRQNRANEAVRIQFGEHRSVVGSPANTVLLPARQPKAVLLIPTSPGIVQVGAVGSRTPSHQRLLLAAGQVPQTDRGVPRARGEAAAVRRKGDRSYNTRMSFKAAQLLAAGEVPQTDRLVPRAGGEGAAVWRKGDRRYSFSMSFEAAQLLAADQVPPDGSSCPRSPRRGCGRP